MIFFGSRIGLTRKYGPRLEKSMGLVAREMPAHSVTIISTRIPHYYLCFYWGYKRYWVGYNRLKRIVRDKVYSLDGRKIFYKDGRNGVFEK